MDAATMPGFVGILFAHAALQVIADAEGVDLLHIKGPALDPVLTHGNRQSIDADVFVRPSHVARMVDGMHSRGWRTQFRFEDGSAFEHAATLVHPILAPVDVHRTFPGIQGDPEVAFERLWIDRRTTALAGVSCAVPSLPVQRLILIIHAARAGRLGHRDIQVSWHDATEEERSAVRMVASEVGASMALAAGTGTLDHFVGVRGYELWRTLSIGEQTRSRVWLARIKAAPTTRDAVRTAVRLIAPNRHRMAERLGREPSTTEVARAYVASARSGATEIARLVKRRMRRR